jgi:predicted metal-dependent hydrolase
LPLIFLKKFLQKKKLIVKEYFFKLDDISFNFIHKKSSIKNSYIRIKNNQVIVSTPNYYTKKDVFELLTLRLSWITKAIQKIKNKIPLSLNTSNLQNIYFLGKLHQTLTLVDKISIKEIEEFYRYNTKYYVEQFLNKYTNIMQLYPNSIAYKKFKRRMGSCDNKNNLQFNIFLSRYNLDVIEYVVVHELAHIKEKNHSKRFYDIVKRYIPNYKQIKQTL